jgi:hypothetical protein
VSRVLAGIFGRSNSLRTASFQAAFSAIQHDPELNVYHQRKRAQAKERLKRLLGD